MTDELFRIRPADWTQPRERNCVRKSWIRSHAASGMARLAGQRAYYSGQHELVDWLLDHAETRVACSPRDPTTIIGWACVAGDVVHYVWVQEDFRRHGVARALLHGLAEHVQYTHRTDMLREVKLPDGWWFNPYGLVKR